MIKKHLFLILLIAFFVNCNSLLAQIEHIAHFADDQNIDSIKSTLKYYNLPFKIRGLEMESEPHIEIYYKNKKSKIISTYSTLAGIHKIYNNDKYYYLINFYDYVGYDFFVIVDENPFKVYYSENYNYKQDEGYDFIYKDFNIENGELKIIYSKSKEQETVKYKLNNSIEFR